MNSCSEYLKQCLCPSYLGGAILSVAGHFALPIVDEIVYLAA